MKRSFIFCLVGVLCILAAVLVALCYSKSDKSSNISDRASEAPETVYLRKKPMKQSVKPSEVSAADLKRRPRRPPKPVLELHGDEDDEEDDTRTPAEKALAARIEKALDEEDMELAFSCVDEARSCAVTEIRQAMVDTLGWFGEKALPELTPFLADSDEDVRESAMNEWTMALSSIEDDGVKIGIVELAMGVLRDEDDLESISSEYIGVDEKLAVESLVRIITSGTSPAGVEKAKETYEFVTGDEWAGVEEAVRWIAEEYEPPEVVESVHAR